MTQIVSQNNFNDIINIIEQSKSRALKAVNAEMINMYWQIGKYLSGLCENSSFGDKVVDEVAAYIAKENPDIKGFNRRGLYRMKQFYELYKDDEFVSTLLTQINWSNHLLIMSGTKSAEERHFYMQACIKERYSYRELERQMDSALYQRYMLSSKKALPKSVPAAARESILDSYVLEFLDLPEQYSLFLNAISFVSKQPRRDLIFGSSIPRKSCVLDNFIKNSVFVVVTTDFHL